MQARRWARVRRCTSAWRSRSGRRATAVGGDALATPTGAWPTPLISRTGCYSLVLGAGRGNRRNHATFNQLLSSLQMVIPAFDKRGFLPPFLGADATTPLRSPYLSTMLELVNTLGTSPERLNILFGLLKYRLMLTSFGYTVGEQFIDGSFVEDVETTENRAPGDVDVLSLVVRPAPYQGNSLAWQTAGVLQWKDQIINHSLNKQRYLVDSYAVAVDQIGPVGLIDATIYWYSLFSHKKVSQHWKGFVRIPLDANDDVLALASIVSGP
jgi:hypothetical protein